ncbi:hypothetical protein LCGC14_2898340 [marine sediment metagenome]|uniref:Uncharacterized protein n=1 Tax=marine sediment metagenome TaxID=412755 RepID=A0A0F8YH14_9ZZZZ
MQKLVISKIEQYDGEGYMYVSMIDIQGYCGFSEHPKEICFLGITYTKVSYNHKTKTVEYRTH